MCAAPILSGFPKAATDGIMRHEQQIARAPLRLRHSHRSRAGYPRKDADRLACIAWNKLMLEAGGPAQPSPTLGDALNAGFGYIEVRCLGCDTNQTVALDVVRGPKATPIYELERYMRCKDCSQLRGYPYKRTALIALRGTKILAADATPIWSPHQDESRK